MKIEDEELISLQSFLSREIKIAEDDIPRNRDKKGEGQILVDHGYIRGLRVALAAVKNAVSNIVLARSEAKNKTLKSRTAKPERLGGK